VTILETGQQARAQLLVCWRLPLCSISTSGAGPMIPAWSARVIPRPGEDASRATCCYRTNSLEA